MDIDMTGYPAKDNYFTTVSEMSVICETLIIFCTISISSLNPLIASRLDMESEKIIKFFDRSTQNFA